MRLRAGSDGRLAVCGAAATVLTALSMTPLVADGQWWLGALLVVLTVMLAGIALRQLSGIPVVVPLGQLLALFAVLVLMFARGELLDPPGAVRAMVELVRAGLQTSREQAAPVDPSTGVIFLLVGGTGLIGLLVDTLAATLRQSALAGLPLLALFCIPAALLPAGLPWYLFVLAAVGFLALLSADAEERMLSWGRVLGGNRGGTATTPAASRLGAGGRRAAVIAVVAALVVPTAAPGLDNRLFGEDGFSSGEGSGGAINRINPILTLRDDLNDRQDTELLRYQSTVSDPEPLRIVTAEDFTGRVWQPGTPRIPRANRVQNGLPAPPGLTTTVATRLERTSIAVGPLRQTYLPLPYPARTVDIDGDWLYDDETLNVIGDHVTTQGVQYTVRHLEVSPTSQQLASAPPGLNEVSTDYVRLPKNLPQIIRDTAVQVGGEGNGYERAVRLQRWLRDTFTYSTRAPKVGSDDSGMASVAAFLRDRRGYCVHFASAMAVMARVLRIPSRVAIGFLPGDRRADGTMVVTAHDAHAWPELYFSGVGWVRFEPTPRGAATGPPAWTVPSAAARPSESASASSSAAAPSASDDAPSATRATRPENLDAGAQSSLVERVPWRLLAAAGLLLVALSLPAVAALAGRRHRWRVALVTGPDGPRARSEAAWDELRARLSDLGVAWPGSWTPRATVRGILTEHELAEGPAGALRRLAADLEEARYAPPGRWQGDGDWQGDGRGDPQGDREGDRPPADRQADVRAVVAAVAETRSRPVRLRAAAFPRSGADALRDLIDAAGRRWAGLTGRAGSRLRRRSATSDVPQVDPEPELARETAGRR